MEGSDADARRAAVRASRPTTDQTREDAARARSRGASEVVTAAPEEPGDLRRVHPVATRGGGVGSYANSARWRLTRGAKVLYLCHKHTQAWRKDEDLE